MNSSLGQFLVQSTVTTVLFVLIALAYAGIIFFLMRRGRWGSVAAGQAIPAVTVGAVAFALIFPALVTYAQIYVRPHLPTLDDVDAFRRAAALALLLGMGATTLLAAVGSAWWAVRRGTSAVNASLLSAGLLLAFWLVTYPFWNLVYSCGTGQGLLLHMPC